MVNVLRSTNLTNDGRLDLSDIAVRALPKAKTLILAPKQYDILLERSGGGPDQPVGRVGFVDRDLQGHAFSNFLHLLRPNADKIDPRFLAWVLYRVNNTGRIVRLEQQTTQMRNLHFRDYLTMPVPVPPLCEQAAIARILDAVDTAIERTRAAVEQAREVKRSVIQQFFFSAMGETAYADRPTKRLRHGWSIQLTDSLLTMEPKNGVSPKASAEPPGTPTFSIAAVRDGHIDLDNPNNLKYVQVPEKAAVLFAVKKGDVLIVRGNANPDLVGKAGMVNRFPKGCLYPDITKRVVFRNVGERTVTPEFAVLAWNHAIVHNQILRRAKTSNGTLKINSRDVRQVMLPVPPPDEQSSLVDLVAAVDDKVDALRKVQCSMETLKRSLMHDLLTGRVRVGGVVG